MKIHQITGMTLGATGILLTVMSLFGSLPGLVLMVAGLVLVWLATLLIKSDER